jgi:hypothetical protein
MDQRGIEGLPLKLLIVALLLSISFPSVWQTLIYYDSTVIIEEATSNALEIKGCAVSAFIGGEGNIRTLHVRMRPSMASGEPAIEIGGSPNSASARVISIVSGIGPICTIPLDDPAIEMCTWDGKTIRLEAGESDLVFKAVQSAGSLLIMVRAG